MPRCGLFEGGFVTPLDGLNYARFATFGPSSNRLNKGRINEMEKI